MAAPAPAGGSAEVPPGEATSSTKRRRAGELPIEVRLQPLPGVGCLVLGLDTAAATAEDLGAPELAQLAAGLRQRSLLLFRGKPGLSPAQLRGLYVNVHRALGLECTLPARKRSEAKDGNSYGSCFPGFPETNVLGFAEGVSDWHGVSGDLRPGAWWERASCQFHHDGGFSAASPPPPALVAMYCEEAPVRGGSLLRWPCGAQLAYASGATLFYSTRLALQLAPPALAARARAMTCCYRRGFGQVKEGVYPVMSPTWLTPATSDGAVPQGDTGHRSITEFESLEGLAFGDAGPPHAGGAAALYEGGAFRHSLVQTDEVGEYVMVHAVCLDCLEEEGVGALAREASLAFIEELLAPAARPPHVLAVPWEPGDVLIFDNRCLQHSVTPTSRNGEDPGYAALGERRLMTRTAMQPSWIPQLRKAGQSLP